MKSYHPLRYSSMSIWWSISPRIPRQFLLLCERDTNTTSYFAFTVRGVRQTLSSTS